MKRSGRIVMMALSAFVIACASAWFVFRAKASEAVNTFGLNIQGMHCAACVVTVRKSLYEVPGVSRVRVDAARGRATVSLKDSTTGVQELIRAVNNSGFKASASDPSSPDR